jgi:hypothetical protein
MRTVGSGVGKAAVIRGLVCIALLALTDCAQGLPAARPTPPGLAAPIPATPPAPPSPLIPAPVPLVPPPEYDHPYKGKLVIQRFSVRLLRLWVVGAEHLLVDG